MENNSKEILSFEPNEKKIKNSFTTKIIDAINFLITPRSLAMLHGITETDLKSMILDDKALLQQAREELYKLSLRGGELLFNGIEKKAVADTVSGLIQNHIEIWTSFLATDYNNSIDYILYETSIKGGIGGNKHFWKNATQEMINAFKVCLNDDINYTRLFFDAIEGVNFKLGVHHKAIFKELNNVLSGGTDVLIINLPPRVGKSTSVYAWATKVLMTKPNSNILYGSYGEVVLTLIRKRMDTAFKKSQLNKNEINPFYEIFNVTKQNDYDKESDFITTINSSFFSATILGGVTGRGYSVFSETNGAMILDDPNNPNDVDTLRMETTNDKFDITWNSRRGKNPLIVTMQRVAENDVTGHVLNVFRDSVETKVKVLTMPLILDEEVLSYLELKRKEYPNIEFIDPQKYMKIGDSLLPIKDAVKIKEATHPSVYKTQYLQIPTSLDGEIFKKKMFYNQVVNISPVTNANNAPIGYVTVHCKERELIDNDFKETSFHFDGVFIIHVDTTAGNTSSDSQDLDDCVWTIMVGGLKERDVIDNFFGAILQQYSINGSKATPTLMQEKTLEIINAINSFYHKEIQPYIFIGVEAHAQGGSLSAFLKGTNIPNCRVFSFSRQNRGDKKQRFLNASGFYEKRIFWHQNKEPLFIIKDLDNSKKNRDWFYTSKTQHLTCQVDNNNSHDDFIEAVADLANLWIADSPKDIFYKDFIKWRQN